MCVFCACARVARFSWSAFPLLSTRDDCRFCTEEEFKALLLQANMLLGNAHVVRSLAATKEGAPPPNGDGKRSPSHCLEITFTLVCSIASSLSIPFPTPSGT